MALFNVRDLQIFNANEDTFGVDQGHTDFVANARSVRCVNQPVVTPAQVATDNPALRQRLARQLAPILGLKNASKIAFACALRGTGTAAGNATAALGAADLAEGQLLKNAFGGESLGTGTTINDVTPSATEFDLTSAAGLSEGQAILVAVGSGYEASVIANIATNTITLSRALSAAPSNGATVYASATYYPIESISGTLQFQAIGAESTDGYYRMLGCQADCKFSNLAPGQLPQLDFDVMASGWNKYAAATLAAATYSNTVNAPVPGYASSLFVVDHGGTTRNLVHCSAITIDPGLAVEAIGSVSGTQGIQGYARSGIAPVVDMTLYPWSDDFHDDFAAGTAKQIHYQIGSTPGQTVLIELQKVVLSEVPARAAIGQQVGVQVKGYGIEDTTIATGELARAAVRLHLL